MTGVAASVISGRIPRPKTPKSRDFARCQCIVLVHFLSLLPMSSVLHRRCPPPSLDHRSTFCWPIIDYDTMSAIAVRSYPWVWVGFVLLTELKLTLCRFSSHSVDFASLRSPWYHRVPVGLKASRSVFPDLVFLSLLILLGHHPSYIDAYSCLHPFEPHTHINHYRFSFSVGVLSSLLFHYISSRLRYVFWSLMLNSQCSNHHFFNLLVTCVARNNLSIVTVLPAICAACYDPSTDHASLLLITEHLYNLYQIKNSLILLLFSWLCAAHWSEVDFVLLQFALCWLCVTEVTPVPPYIACLKTLRCVFLDIMTGGMYF